MSSPPHPSPPPSSYRRTPSYRARRAAALAPSPDDHETLFAELQPLIRSLTRQYGVDPDLREDLPGEIYCHFSRLLDAYDPARGIPLRPYLIRGLTTAVYTVARSCWRRRGREVALGTDLGAAGTGGDPTPLWDQALLREELLAVLPSMIDALPHRQRSVLIGRYYEERSFEEIAAQMEVRPSTARSLLRHGLNNLRRRVANPSGDWLGSDWAQPRDAKPREPGTLNPATCPVIARHRE